MASCRFKSSTVAPIDRLTNKRLKAFNGGHCSAAEVRQPIRDL